MCKANEDQLDAVHTQMDELQEIIFELGDEMRRIKRAFSHLAEFRMAAEAERKREMEREIERRVGERVAAIRRSLVEAEQAKQAEQAERELAPVLQLVGAS